MRFATYESLRMRVPSAKLRNAPVARGKRPLLMSEKLNVQIPLSVLVWRFCKTYAVHVNDLPGGIIARYPYIYV